MSIDEAIKHAEEVANENERLGAMGRGNPDKYAPSPEQCFKCAEEHKQLAEWLKELKMLREQTRWIPCSERLPEEDGRYIVTEKRFAIDDRKHMGWYQTIVEEVIFSSGKWDRAKFFEVIAWMPLPDPYREEASE